MSIAIYTIVYMNEIGILRLLYHSGLHFLDNSMDAMLAMLTEREETIIRLRHFDRMKYREIASRFGVTRSRIEQIEARALRKLRHPTRLNAWKIATKFNPRDCFPSISHYEWIIEEKRHYRRPTDWHHAETDEYHGDMDYYGLYSQMFYKYDHQ